VSIGAGGGILSVLGRRADGGRGACLSFVAGGVVAAVTGWSYSLLSVRIRSRGGTAGFLDRVFGTGVAGPLNLLLWLSCLVVLGLYAAAFGACLTALLGLAANGPWPRGLFQARRLGVVLSGPGVREHRPGLAGGVPVSRRDCLRRRADLLEL
jgi:amino acid transporter